MAELSNISIINLAVTKEEVFNPRRASQTWSDDLRSPARLSFTQGFTGKSRAHDKFLSIHENDVNPQPCKWCGMILVEGEGYEIGE